MPTKTTSSRLFLSFLIVLLLALTAGCALENDPYGEDEDFEATDDALSAKRDLSKIGACFDRAKFDAMGLGQWRTTARTAANNTAGVTPKWTENINNCTGCNNAVCATCHADPNLHFFDVVGSPLFLPEATFEQSKLPMHASSYFSMTSQGRAVASNAIKKKSDATKKSAAYTHPLFILSPEQQAAVDAFVTDAATRFNARRCGQ